MKRVAIIGADFTPSSLPPALRIRFFAQHLPEFGWWPIVITTDAKHYEREVDPENSCLLPESLEVIRTGAFNVKWTRKLGVGDVGMRSMWHHWRALSALHRRRKIDLLFIPVPPYVPMILGRLAYHRLGIPYVIDYIDPWVNDYYSKLPKAQRPPKWAFSSKLARTLEPVSLKHVAHIVGVSKGTTDSVVERYSWLSEEDAVAIPYGGEAGDPEYLRAHPRQNNIFNRDDGLFHISYIGAYTEAMQSTLRALFAALRLGAERAPELFKRLRLHFVGTTYAPDKAAYCRVLPIAREMEVEGFVDEHPTRVSYLDALQLVLDSHALLILGSDTPHYTASKIFPYILAHKPLLTVFHEASSVVKIVRETQAGEVITFSDQCPPSEKVQEIYEELERFILNSADYRPPTRWEAFEPYTTRAMTARLAKAFDSVCGNIMSDECANLSLSGVR
jgi:hypothetical protein